MHSFPQALIDGYASFIRGPYTETEGKYRTLAREGQSPVAMVIACCDSRAAPETIFDASAGELFVVRNVANLVPPYAPDGERHSTSAALEFAVHSLGVSNIVVMGHGKCGGIAAVVKDMSPLSKGDFIGKWMVDVKEVVDTVALPHDCADHEKHTVIERASVEHSLENLLSFPWVARLAEAGELAIIGAWFDIALGELYVYDAANKDWQKCVGE